MAALTHTNFLVFIAADWFDSNRTYPTNTANPGNGLLQGTYQINNQPNAAQIAASNMFSASHISYEVFGRIRYTDV